MSARHISSWWSVKRANDSSVQWRVLTWVTCSNAVADTPLSTTIELNTRPAPPRCPPPINLLRNYWNERSLRQPDQLVARRIFLRMTKPTVYNAANCVFSQISQKPNHHHHHHHTLLHHTTNVYETQMASTITCVQILPEFCACYLWPWLGCHPTSCDTLCTSGFV